MKTIFYVVFICIVLLFNSFALSADSEKSINAEQVITQCLSSKWQIKDLVQLKKNKFVLENKDEKEALALQLLHCLADPDPEVRDGIAFETLSYWLRNEQLGQSIHIEMFNYLTRVLTAKVNDPNGVYQSFSMLVLAEIARVDRKLPFLSDKQRSYLVSVATRFLSNIRDYRAFSDQVGWRHSVAHSSDLMLQLALNPAITKRQLDTMLTALASQITAKNQHYYTNGESKRISMAVIYIFLRGEHSVIDWNSWLKNVVKPFPFEQWQDVYQSEIGLIKLHNTQSFLYALYATIKPSKNVTLVEMIPNVELAIKEVK